MTTFYTSYVNHILRFYTRIPEGAEPRFRTEADRLNYEAAHKVFCTLKDNERTALRTVFGARSDGGEYNEDGIWQPSKEGLGMGHVFDELNKIYGEGFIRY